MDSDIKKENERKKVYLKRYGTALKVEEALNEEIRQLRLDRMFPAFQQDGMPRGSGGCGDLSGYVAKVDELMQELKIQMEVRLQIRREINKRIESIPDEIEKLVLRLRYIHMLKWEEIAIRMGYTYRYVLKIHGQALNNFKVDTQ